jgi:hypothetical protein
VENRGPVVDHLTILEKFVKLGPTTFRGDPDATKAELWIEEMEKILETMRCSDEQKVTFASFKLVGAAEYWWRMLKGKWELAGTVWTWANFVGEFKRRFIPAIYQDKREAEFLKLEQGNMTIAQYEAKYNTLARYNPHLVPDEATRAKRFVKGLRSEFRSRMVVLGLTNYYDAVEKGYAIENDIEEHKGKRESFSEPTGNRRVFKSGGKSGRTVSQSGSNNRERQQ